MSDSRRRLHVALEQLEREIGARQLSPVREAIRSVGALEYRNGRRDEEERRNSIGRRAEDRRSFYPTCPSCGFEERQVRGAQPVEFAIVCSSCSTTYRVRTTVHYYIPKRL